MVYLNTNVGQNVIIYFFGIFIYCDQRINHNISSKNKTISTLVVE